MNKEKEVKKDVIKSAGAAEYIEYISAEESDPQLCVMDMTLNNLMVRVQ